MPLPFGVSSVPVTDGYTAQYSNGKSFMKMSLIITTGFVQYMLLLQYCHQ